MPGRVDIICKALIQFLAELNTELKNFMFARLEGLRREGEGGGAGGKNRRSQSRPKGLQRFRRVQLKSESSVLLAN